MNPFNCPDQEHSQNNLSTLKIQHMHPHAYAVTIMGIKVDAMTGTQGKESRSPDNRKTIANNCNDL